jgi:hypothetical protein
MVHLILFGLIENTPSGAPLHTVMATGNLSALSGLKQALNG